MPRPMTPPPISSSPASRRHPTMSTGRDDAYGHLNTRFLPLLRDARIAFLDRCAPRVV